MKSLEAHAGQESIKKVSCILYINKLNWRSNYFDRMLWSCFKKMVNSGVSGNTLGFLRRSHRLEALVVLYLLLPVLRLSRKFMRTSVNYWEPRHQITELVILLTLVGVTIILLTLTVICHFGHVKKQSPQTVSQRNLNSKLPASEMN